MMKPMLVRFPDATLKWLRTRALKLGIPVAELLRRVVDDAKKKGAR